MVVVDQAVRIQCSDACHRGLSWGGYRLLRQTGHVCRWLGGWWPSGESMLFVLVRGLGERWWRWAWEGPRCLGAVRVAAGREGRTLRGPAARAGAAGLKRERGFRDAGSQAGSPGRWRKSWGAWGPGPCRGPFGAAVSLSLWSGVLLSCPRALPLSVCLFDCLLPPLEVCGGEGSPLCSSTSLA